MMSSREVAVAAPAAPSSVDLRILLRGLVRNWWLILLLWLGLSAPSAYLIYNSIQPTYTASGMVKVESNQPDLFGPSTDLYGRSSQPTYLLTEIETMRSNPVLALALAGNDPRINTYPLLKESKDPKNDLRQKLSFSVIPNTHWIRVAVESASPYEARDIVNAVIKAYEEVIVIESLGTPTNQKLSTKNQTAKKISDSFRAYRENLEKKIQAVKDRLRSLARSDDALASKDKQESKTWNSRVNEVEASFLRDDLARYYPMFDLIDRKLESLEFTKDKAGIEIERTDEADLPKVPNSNELLRYTALVPVVVLVSLLGLFMVFGDLRRRQDGGKKADQASLEL